MSYNTVLNECIYSIREDKWMRKTRTKTKRMSQGDPTSCAYIVGMWNGGRATGWRIINKVWFYQCTRDWSREDKGSNVALPANLSLALWLETRKYLKTKDASSLLFPERSRCKTQAHGNEIVTNKAPNNILLLLSNKKKRSYSSCCSRFLHPIKHLG